MAVRCMSRPLEGRQIELVGAGVAGLTAAVALAERGAQVTVHERASALGGEACSWLAGGMLAPGCEREGSEACVSERGAMALDWWAKRVPGVSRLGSLVLAPARDQAELQRFARRTDGHRLLDAEGLAALEPALAGRFERALWFADEGHLDPRRALPALVERLQALGGRLQLGAAVDPAALPAPTVVDCRGLAAREALPALRGVRGEMLLLRSRELRLRRPVRLLHPRIPMYVVPRADGLLMLGATSIESEHAGPVSVRSALELLNAAYVLHPALAEAEIVEFGVGVRPAFADNLPRVQRQGRVVHFNGLYRHGFLLAPWYAEQLAIQMAEAEEIAA